MKDDARRFEDTQKLVDAIVDLPAIRRSFREDPLSGLDRISKHIGVDPAKVDLKTVELLASLTDEEARLLSALKVRVDQLRIDTKDVSGGVLF